MVFKPAVVVLQTVHEKVPPGDGAMPQRPEERMETGKSTTNQITDLGHKAPTELLYMLVQIDSVCSSEQSRENYVTLNIEIKLPTSLIKN